MSVVCRNGHYQHLFWWLCWKNVPVSFLENLPRLGEVKIWGCAIIGTFWVIHLGTMMRLMELTKLVIPLLGENSSASITHQTSMWLDLGWCKGFLHFSISGKNLIWHAELEWNYNPWLLFFSSGKFRLKKKVHLTKQHTLYLPALHFSGEELWFFTALGPCYFHLQTVGFLQLQRHTVISKTKISNTLF